MDNRLVMRVGTTVLVIGIVLAVVGVVFSLRQNPHTGDIYRIGGGIGDTLYPLGWAMAVLGGAVCVVGYVVMPFIRNPRSSPPSRSTRSPVAFCRHCGQSIPKDSTFCEHCGKQL